MGWALSYTSHVGYFPPDLRPQFQESVGSRDPLEHVRYAAQIGMAGVLDPWMVGRPIDEREGIAAVLAETGLVSSCIVAVPLEATFSAPWADRTSSGRTAVERYVRTAAQLATSVRSGMLAAVITADPKVSESTSLDNVVANLADVARIAADHGLLIGVEPMLSIPNSLLRTTDDGIRLIERVDHPAVRLIFDTGHSFMMDGDVLTALDRARAHLGLLQLVDAPGRVEAGAGDLPLVELATRAVTGGYGGLVDFEHDWSRPGREGESAGLLALHEFDERLHAALSARAVAAGDATDVPTA